MHRTWVFDKINQVIAEQTPGNGYDSQRTNVRLYRFIKDSLLSLDGCTLRGSSDGTSVGALDGVDRWTSDATLGPGIDFGVDGHPWVVLRFANMRGAPELLISLIPGDDSDLTPRFVWSGTGAGFTGGDVETDPAATDEIEYSSAFDTVPVDGWTFVSDNGHYVLHVLYTDDGAQFRVVVLRGGVIIMTLMAGDVDGAPVGTADSTLPNLTMGTFFDALGAGVHGATAPTAADNLFMNYVTLGDPTLATVYNPKIAYTSDDGAANVGVFITAEWSGTCVPDELGPDLFTGKQLLQPQRWPERRGTITDQYWIGLGGNPDMGFPPNPIGTRVWDEDGNAWACFEHIALPWDSGAGVYIDDSGDYATWAPDTTGLPEDYVAGDAVPREAMFYDLPCDCDETAPSGRTAPVPIAAPYTPADPEYTDHASDAVDRLCEFLKRKA